MGLTFWLRPILGAVIAVAAAASFALSVYELSWGWAIGSCVVFGLAIKLASLPDDPQENS